MKTQNWTVKEYNGKNPFRVYIWKNYIVLMQYPNSIAKPSRYYIALTDSNKKLKITSSHEKYLDALVYVRLYQHEAELDYQYNQSCNCFKDLYLWFLGFFKKDKK
jgi:hypothetical protein